MTIVAAANVNAAVRSFRSAKPMPAISRAAVSIP